MPLSAQAEIFQRSLRNCAKAFNLLLAVIVIRAPFAAIVHQYSLTLMFFVAMGLTLAMIGLIGYLIYQCKWHPLALILTMAGLFLPYVNGLTVILVLVFARTFLQNHGYVVGLLRAYEDRNGIAPSPAIPFRRHVPWLIIFAAFPWILFLLIVIINWEYAAKLFLPHHCWLGPLLLFAALVMSVLNYPLSIEYQRLRAFPNVTVTSVVQLGMVLSLSLLFALISLGILVLGPAGITMAEQMNKPI